ncbi:MAG: PAS domain-containing protein [Desulfobacterales bacterium]|nr:PAS domain-containing protein [Desulfobacterales bacterium]
MKITYEELEQKVSKLVQTNQHLKESLDKYQTIYKQSPIAIEIYDEKGFLIDVNQACLDIFGVIDKKELFFFNLFKDPNLDDKYKNKLKNGEPVRYQVAFDFDKVKKLNLYSTFRSGIIWLDVLITFFGGKSINGYLVQVQDITERKNIEEALKESEEYYKNLVENQTDCICRWKADTTLTFVNDGYCNFFGKTRDELLGTQWLRLIPDSSRENVKNFYQKIVAEKKSYRYEHEVIAANKQISWQSWINIPIILDGKVIEYQSIGRDTTERKKFETERENIIQELQSAIEQIKTLRGIVPICSSCKKIRDDKGYWEQVEAYVSKHTDAQFTHSICPKCIKKLYPEISDKIR